MDFSTAEKILNDVIAEYKQVNIERDIKETGDEAKAKDRWSCWDSGVELLGPADAKTKFETQPWACDEKLVGVYCDIQDDGKPVFSDSSEDDLRQAVKEFFDWSI